VTTLVNWFKSIFILVFALLLLSPLASGAAEGNRLAFVRGGNIWIADSHGAGAQQLTLGGKAGAPALSRDGKWVAFTNLEGNRNAIYVAPTGGGPLKRVKLPGISEAWAPAFTPDGKSLALVTRFNVQKRRVDGEVEEYATHAISLADLDTGKVRHVVQTPNHFMDAGDLYEGLAVSPDGRLIAYQESGTDVSGGFVVLTLDGKKVLRFPGNPEDYRPFWRPAFSPDGSKVLCFSLATTEGEKTWVYLVDLKTRKAARVIQGYYPTLVDGGRAIVFERWTETGGIGRAATKIDLWRLGLTPGATPRRILENAERPAGAG
jgi:tricorn protease-like protein